MSGLIACVADCHIGNHKNLGGPTVGRLNKRCHETIHAFRAACERARDNDADALVVLGDLFDTDDPSPTMVRAVMDALKKGPKRIILLLGNHEMHSDAPHDHALASMAGVWDGQKIDVIDKPTMCWVGELALAMVPFRPGQAKECLGKAISECGPSAAPPLLCIHLGVSDSQTERDEPWMMGSHDQIHVDDLDKLIAKHNLSGVAAGNWHQHMLWGDDGEPPILQCGALIPTGWNNQGGDDLYGSLVFWDGEGFDREVIPGPRYLKFDDYKKWVPYAGREDIRARIVVPATRLGMFQAKLDAEHPMGYAEILPDSKTTHRRARSAAVASRAQADDRSALAAFCERTEKPEGVTAGEVLETCEEYLG